MLLASCTLGLCMLNLPSENRVKALTIFEFILGIQRNSVIKPVVSSAFCIWQSNGIIKRKHLS